MIRSQPRVSSPSDDDAATGVWKPVGTVQPDEFEVVVLFRSSVLSIQGTPAPAYAP
jgi:hypothetical protein